MPSTSGTQQCSSGTRSRCLQSQCCHPPHCCLANYITQGTSNGATAAARKRNTTAAAWRPVCQVSAAAGLENTGKEVQVTDKRHGRGRQAVITCSGGSYCAFSHFPHPAASLALLLVLQQVRRDAGLPVHLRNRTCPSGPSRCNRHCRRCHNCSAPAAPLYPRRNPSRNRWRYCTEDHAYCQWRSRSRIGHARGGKGVNCSGHS